MKIGNIDIKGNIVQAPMAGVSNPVFRLIAKQHGADLVCAEMVSIEGMNHNNKKTFEMLEVHESEHPMSMQIFGNDVKSFIKATKWIEENVNCDIIDLNLGCPAPKIAIKSASGSSLLKTPELIFEIVKAVVANTSKPVTAKIRLGWDKESVNAVEVAQLIEKAGASAITVHGRTRNDFYKGKVDWEKIKEVKQAVTIPVIGNGDIIDGPSAKAMLDLTGCDGVMIARASQGNPWIFKEIKHYLLTGEPMVKPTLEEWKKTVIFHAQSLIELRSNEEFGAREFRKHLVWYLNSQPNIPKSAELKEKANQVLSMDNIFNIVNSVRFN